MQGLFQHSRTTGDVTVRAGVSFLPDQSEPGRGRWFWACHIRIENGGSHAIQLLGRDWSIVDGRGGRQQVKAEGVIGAQPVIDPGESFDYVAPCPLNTPSGFVEGSYEMVAEDGTGFAAALPRIPLIAPVAAS